MKPQIKIALIGGTGKSGKYVVKQLLHQGFQIKMLLRNPDNFTIKNPLVEIVTGNVTDADSIYCLLEGCQAVISTLGLGIPPSEPTIFSQSTATIIKAMELFKIDRYIVTTGLNVDTPFDKKTYRVSMATEWMKKEYPLSTANKQEEYEILAKSTVDWTLIRLPLIEQTDQINEVGVNLEDCLGEKISAADLASFISMQLFNKDYIKKAPFIATI